MPAGEDVTVPVPLPDLETVRVCWLAAKVAVQLMSVSRVTDPSVQSAFPLQPLKVDPGSAVAVSETTVPWS